MTFLELAKKRFTSRSFIPRPVSNEDIMYILEAARVAPSMGNTQSVRIYVLESKEKLRKLSAFAQVHDAPAALIICSEIDTAYKDPVELTNSGFADATVATTHIILAAADIDLGSVWVMKFNPEKIRTLFEIPKGTKPIHIIGLGKTAEVSNPNRHGLKRLPLTKIASFLDQ